MRFYILTFLLLNCICSFAKIDSLATPITMIGAQVSVDLPMADLAKRFGIFDKVGVSVSHKTKSNWIFGTRFHFMFGSQIKEPNFLSNLATTASGTITTDGSLSGLRLFQRGYNVGLDIGKIFPFWKANEDSGPMWLSSFGFIQHKINIYDRDIVFPQVFGDYKKGYDRLTNGLYAEALIGYMYFGKKRNLNGFIGLNINVASTQGRREWWFDTQTTGLDKRIDASTGLVISWFVPIHQKKTEEVYY